MHSSPVFSCAVFVVQNDLCMVSAQGQTKKASFPIQNLWKQFELFLRKKKNCHLFAPENENHAPRKLSKNDDDLFKMSLGEFGHNGQVFFCDACCKQHARASPYERPLKKDLTKIFIICKKFQKIPSSFCQSVIELNIESCRVVRLTLESASTATAALRTALNGRSI